ncbi:MULTISPECIES: porin [Pandoraea]|uniref:porin n=1 Tax=Pandoraea TaxID=93217 RepID=UPI001F5DAD41|nr:MULTISPECIES: porin [Pandoraea]MCI3203528.1 porin [Pandoraea sp. LA3]MDN4581554.1 porin [Pandoraea capi]
MKKHVIASTLALMSGAVFAQSSQGSVSIYGEIDAGVSYINNAGGASTTRARSGAWDGSRWGFLGNEDLGGGYQAIFRLENGFDAMTGNLGQNGREFGRQAYVGVGTPYGVITVGRQYDPIVDNLGTILANGRGSSPMFDLDNTGNDYATNNSVKFKSLNYKGLSFSTMYAFGGVAGQMGTNSAWGAGVNYSNGPLSAGAAYTSVHNPYAVWYNSTGASSIATYGAYLPSANALNIAAVGAAYAFGQLTVRGGMTHSVLTQAAAGNNVQFNTYVLQGDYMLRPDIRLSAAVDLTNAGIGGTGKRPKYRQYNLVADYILSKRTDVYVWLIYGTAAGSDVAQIGQLPASSTNRQLNTHIGIRHRF